ncbi:MAG TPA: DUF4142 domain-containing protein, partial [Thermoanaerobaculia bacterium]
SRLIVITSVLLLVAACSTNQTMTSSSSMPVMGSGYSDADIAGILRAANQGEIDAGNAASTRASSDDVRAFARMMVSDHTSALDQANSLFTRTNIRASDNDLSRNLQNNSQQTLGALNSYTGADFDRQYINSQVAAHQWLLGTLDSALIPSAHNRQLRTFLSNVRTTVTSHLDRARQIQTKLR